MRKVETFLLSILIISAFFLPCLAGCQREGQPLRGEVEEGVRVDVSGDAATVRWAPLAGAESYTLYRSVSTFGAREQVAAGLKNCRYDFPAATMTSIPSLR